MSASGRLGLAPLGALALALALFPAPRPARAQQGDLSIAAFRPSAPGDRFFAVQDPYAEGRLAPKLALLADYAYQPVVLYRLEPDGSAGPPIGSLLSDQLALHAGVALAAWDRLLVSLDWPALVVNTGSALEGIPSPAGLAVGDLAAGARVRLLGAPDRPFAAALTASLGLPTAGDVPLVGEAGVRGAAGFALGGSAGALIWAANAGLLFRPEASFADTTVDNQIVFGAAAGARLAGGAVQLGSELTGGVVVTGEDAAAALTTNLEALFGAKIRHGSVAFGAAMGPGLTRGLGTPGLRLLATTIFAPASNPDRDADGIENELDACPDKKGPPSPDPKKNGCPAPSDRDGDEIPDPDDACPDEKGPPNQDPEKNGCPIPGDRDGDKIPDPDDACPDEKGPPNQDPEKNGCPLPGDRDGDGIPDDKDACPDHKGLLDEDPAKNGCPGDRDGDGISDDKDACPREKGPPSDDADKNGCPTKVRVTETKIEILQQVQFALGSDVILPESDDVLSQIAGVLAEHPEITRVLIEGHTDSSGGAALNRTLSERRAASVKRWLVRRGRVDPGRLDAQGFGMERPIDDNTTEEGRRRNRRVEFRILETKKPAPTKPAPTKPAPTKPAPTKPAPGPSAPPREEPFE